MKGILIGTGNMGIEYCKVLKGLGVEFDVVGRREENANKFKDYIYLTITTGSFFT